MQFYSSNPMQIRHDLLFIKTLMTKMTRQSPSKCSKNDAIKASIITFQGNGMPSN